MHDRLGYISRTSEARGVAQQKLCTIAGLSAGWLSGALTRAKKDESYKPDHRTLAKLAVAAGVSLLWLEDGEGSPEAGIAPAPRLPARTVPDATKPAELALVEAFRRHPDRYTAEDFLAALRVVGSDTEAKLSDDRERAVVAMGRVLGAVTRLRRDGDAVTFEALAMTLAADDAGTAGTVGTAGANGSIGVTRADGTDDAEGRAQLAALGAAPPKEPVRTPGRGTPSVPRPPEKKSR